MSAQISKETFEQFYNATYRSALKYAICHCKDLSNVNDIIQETYTELFKKVLDKKYIDIENEQAYLIGIIKKKIKRNYFSLNKYVSLDDEDDGNRINIEDKNINIEENLVNKDNVQFVWDYLKKKNDLVARIFYLFYVMELPIRSIARELGMTQSNVKNYIYRTQRDLKLYLGKESDY